MVADETHVVYKAVADFSSLIKDAAKARAALAAMEKTSGSLSGSLKKLDAELGVFQKNFSSRADDISKNATNVGESYLLMGEGAKDAAKSQRTLTTVLRDARTKLKGMQAQAGQTTSTLKRMHEVTVDSSESMESLGKSATGAMNSMSNKTKGLNAVTRDFIATTRTLNQLQLSTNKATKARILKEESSAFEEAAKSVKTYVKELNSLNSLSSAGSSQKVTLNLPPLAERIDAGRRSKYAASQTGEIPETIPDSVLDIWDEYHDKIIEVKEALKDYNVQIKESQKPVIRNTDGDQEAKFLDDLARNLRKARAVYEETRASFDRGNSSRTDLNFTKKIFEQAQSDYASGLRKFNSELHLTDAIGGSFGRTVRSMAQDHRNLQTDIDGSSTRLQRFTRIFRASSREADSAGKALKGLKSGFDSIANIRVGGTPTITTFLAGIASIASLVGPALSGIGALGVAVAGLAANISSMAGAALTAFPALAALGTGAGALVVAFNGVKTAMSAALKDGVDSEAYATAAAGLSASADQFVRNMVSMKGAWADMRRNVQESFFSRIAADVPKLSSGISVLERMLSSAASALGGVASAGIQMVTSNRWLSDFDTIGKQSVPILQGLGNGFLFLMQAAKDLTVVAGPLAARFSEAFQAFSMGIANSVEAGRASGALATYLDGVYDKVSQWVRIIGNVGTALYNFGKASGQTGQDIVDSFERITESWKRSSESAVKAGSPFQDFIRNTKPLLDTLGGALVSLGKTVVTQMSNIRNINEITNVIRTITDVIGPALLSVFASLRDAGLPSIIAGIAGSVATLIASFTKNGGAEVIHAVGAAIKTVIDAISGLMEIPGFATVFVPLVVGAGAVISATLTLIPAIQGVGAALGMLGIEAGVATGALSGVAASLGAFLLTPVGLIAAAAALIAVTAASVAFSESAKESKAEASELQASIERLDSGTTSLEIAVRNASDGWDSFWQNGYVGSNVDKQIENLQDTVGWFDEYADAMDGMGFAEDAWKANNAGTIKGFKDLGKQLATLAQTDAPAAMRAFKDIADTTSMSDRQFQAMVESSGEFKNSLIDMANAAGVAIGDLSTPEQWAALHSYVNNAKTDTVSFTEQITGMADASQEATDKLNGFTDALLGLIDVQQRKTDTALQFLDAKDALQELINKIPEVGQVFADQANKGSRAWLEAEGALQAVASAGVQAAIASVQAGGSVDDAMVSLEGARQTVIDSAIALGMAKPEAEAYANSLHLIPADIRTQLEMYAAEIAGNEAAIRILESDGKTVTIKYDLMADTGKAEFLNVMELIAQIEGRHEIYVDTLSADAEAALEAIGVQVERLDNGSIQIKADAGDIEQVDKILKNWGTGTPITVPVNANTDHLQTTTENTMRLIAQKKYTPVSLDGDPAPVFSVADTFRNFWATMFPSTDLQATDTGASGTLNRFMQKASASRPVATLDANPDPAGHQLDVWEEHVNDSRPVATLDADPGPAEGVTRNWFQKAASARPYATLDANSGPAQGTVNWFTGWVGRLRPDVGIGASTWSAQSAIDGLINRNMGRSATIYIDTVERRFTKAGYADGGAITGGVPNKDSVPIMAMPGEHVWTTKEVNALGGQGAMYALRRFVRENGKLPAYANGGETPRRTNRNLNPNVSFNSRGNYVNRTLDPEMTVTINKNIRETGGQAPVSGGVNVGNIIINNPISEDPARSVARGIRSVAYLGN